MAILKETNITLTPVNGRKSFYGKCKVLQDENGVYFLKSYNTIVCAYNPTNGDFTRLWRGAVEGATDYYRNYYEVCNWSRTTNDHVDGFRVFFGLGRISKKEWLAI